MIKDCFLRANKRAKISINKGGEGLIKRKRVCEKIWPKFHTGRGYRRADLKAIALLERTKQMEKNDSYKVT